MIAAIYARAAATSPAAPSTSCAGELESIQERLEAQGASTGREGMMGGPFVPAFGPRRTPARRRGLRRVIFLVATASASTTAWCFGCIGAGLALTLFGISLDIVGAFTLAFGLMFVGMARIRQALDRGLAMDATRGQRLPRWLAKRFGSQEPQDTEAYTLDELTETFWGVALLILGFVFQAAGALLSTVP